MTSEKYLDNADDKRLLNLICKLKGRLGGEESSGTAPATLSSPQPCRQDEKAVFKFTTCSRYLMEPGTSACLLPVRSWCTCS